MSLHVRSFGNGPRPAMALHCSLAHGGSWAGLAALVPGLTIRAPDLTGHGKSPGHDPAHDFHTEATRAVLDLLDVPVDLIGHSFGATVALRMALERPEMIRTLTLIEPVLFAAARAAGSPAHAVHVQAMAPFATFLRAGDMRRAAEAFQGVWGHGPLSSLPPRVQDYILARIPLIEAAAPALDRDNAGLLAYGRLEALGVPVLLVEGGASPPVIGAILDELARRLARVTRLSVPGAGHMVPITHPAPVAGAIAELTA